MARNKTSRLREKLKEERLEAGEEKRRYRRMLLDMEKDYRGRIGDLVKANKDQLDSLRRHYQSQEEFLQGQLDDNNSKWFWRLVLASAACFFLGDFMDVFFDPFDSSII